jgi:uncharacterized protein (TIGR02284 family)
MWATNFYEAIMDNRNVISKLNTLIESSKDGVEGFKNCAEDVSGQDAQLKMLFLDKAHNCALAASELEELVRAHGGAPTPSAVVGTVHRSWADIRSALVGKNKIKVLTEYERGEDCALQSYREALEEDLPADVRSVVERQYKGALLAHDRIKSLRARVSAGEDRYRTR